MRPPHSRGAEARDSHISAGTRLGSADKFDRRQHGAGPWPVDGQNCSNKIASRVPLTCCVCIRQLQCPYLRAFSRASVETGKLSQSYQASGLLHIRYQHVSGEKMPETSGALDAHSLSSRERGNSVHRCNAPCIQFIEDRKYIAARPSRLHTATQSQKIVAVPRDKFRRMLVV